MVSFFAGLYINTAEVACNASALQSQAVPFAYMQTFFSRHSYYVGGACCDPGRVDATNWGETQKIIEAIHNLPLDGVESRRDADEVCCGLGGSRTVTGGGFNDDLLLKILTVVPSFRCEAMKSAFLFSEFRPV